MQDATDRKYGTADNLHQLIGRNNGKPNFWNWVLCRTRNPFELFAAAAADSNGARAETDFERIDAYFVAGHTEAEDKYLRFFLRFVADLRPQLKELLGATRGNH